MFRKGHATWNKGRKLPHTKEWEEKRLAAVRIAAAKRRGIPTGRPPTPEVRSALEEWKKLNPGKAKSISISNLPKNCVGSNNGNWKGGKAKIRQEWRIKHSAQISKFRKLIRDRDKVCRDCGSSNRLEVHHIIGLAECEKAFFRPMNAVLLCRNCHKKTDNYCSRGRTTRNKNSKQLVIVKSIPNHWHEYPTCGNWSWCDDVLIVLVTEMSDVSMFAVAVHEITEAMYCRKTGVTEKQVCQFDIRYEQNRMPGDNSEPGDALQSPYREAHQRATHVERAVCAALEVLWDNHERNVQATQ